MIKNIIFDLGRVLLSFEPRPYLEKLYGNHSKTEVLFNAVFKSKSWLDLDRGVIDEEEAINKMQLQAPFPNEIRFLLYHWDEMLIPLESTVRVLEKLKEQNYALYLLSNFHQRAFQNVYQKYFFFRLFDGILISCTTGLIKPDLAIYQKAIDNWSLSPEQSVFIDDTAVNISAAKSLGMEGIVFRDALQLEKDLAGLNVQL